MTLLQEAEELINGQRKEDYGDAKACFKRIATFWSCYLSVRCDIELSPNDVANMMVLFKMARLAQSPTHHDSILDSIGYLALTEELVPTIGDFTTGVPTGKYTGFLSGSQQPNCS